MGEVKITCKTKDYLPLSSIVEFQGKLKKRSKADIERLKKYILEVGFSFPFYIWKNGDINYCLDGHGRIFILQLLAEEGYILPAVFPVVYIAAKDEIEAMEKLLQVNSTYGIITQGGLAEFTEGMDVDLTEMSFNDSYIDFSGNVFSEQGDLSPQQNAMKVAKFRSFVIPVSDQDITDFMEKLALYEQVAGSREGFFRHYMEQYALVKQ